MRHLRNSTFFALSVFLLVASLLPACGKKSIRSEQLEPTPDATSSASVSPSESTTPTMTATPGESLFSVPENEITAVPTVTATPTVSDYSYVPETVTMEQDADTVSAKLKKTAHSAAALKSSSTRETEMEERGEVIEAGLKKPVRTEKSKKVSAKPTSTPPPTATSGPTPLPVSAAFGSMTTETPTGKKSSWKWWGWLFLVLLVLAALWYYLRKSQEDESLPTHPSAPLGGLSPVSGFFASQKKKNAQTPRKNKKD
jgi:hypothetical protein